ncbi:hypothetical protein [Fenollaria sporofastidiosus]|uniref:hypothetical protein n=1 Tax=Fenollaria sporofastidiosus TaxID=2811778 RepID=UPI001C0071CE|nr:hypothetical protein [Fenollaria sporofastidiosus]
MNGKYLIKAAFIILIAFTVANLFYKPIQEYTVYALLLVDLLLIVGLSTSKPERKEKKTDEK